MPTLTLKNLPADVHRRLKAQASRHGRSLNSEAIALLRSGVMVERVDAEAVLATARAHRAKVAGVVRDADIQRLKGEGRP
jgi:plasmid stability protein